MPSARVVVRGVLVAACAVLANRGSRPILSEHTPVRAVRAPVAARMAKLPLRFEVNAGQWDERVRFVARRGATTLFLTDDGMTVNLHGTEGRDGAITMKLAGARPGTPRGEQELATKSNYFVGNDPSRWRTNVQSFGRVRATGWVPGVDVVWHEGGGGLEYDLEVAANVDARALAIDIEGADACEIAEDGSLRLTTAAGVLVQRPPRVVQDDRELRSRYVRTGPDQVRFAIEGYDAARPLLIDPVFLARRSSADRATTTATGSPSTQTGTHTSSAPLHRPTSRPKTPCAGRTPVPRTWSSRS